MNNPFETNGHMPEPTGCATFVNGIPKANPFQDGIPPEWSVEHVVRFEVIIPRTYNPPAPGEPRPPIPAEKIHAVEELIARHFEGCRYLYSHGSFRHHKGMGLVDSEPEWYYQINVPRAEAATAWNWFAHHCSRWAALFKQEAIYLELPGLGLTYLFPPYELSELDRSRPSSQNGSSLPEHVEA